MSFAREDRDRAEVHRRDLEEAAPRPQTAADGVAPKLPNFISSVYMHIYIYIYLCVLCMYVCMYACMYVCLYVCIYYVYMYVYAYVQHRN